MFRRCSILAQIARGALAILLLGPAILACLRNQRVTSGTARLAIAAGPSGWQLIEYQELAESAREYLGESNVVKVQAPAGTIVKYIRQAIVGDHVTHLFYDPRSGVQNEPAATIQSTRIAFICAWHGVTPIGWLADFPNRRWRRQCWIVTALRGVTVTTISSPLVRKWFPHKRLFGPALMPLSRSLAEKLAKEANRPTGKRESAAFIGSLYSPRTEKLDAIAAQLSKHGHSMLIKGRPLGSGKVSNEDYWASLVGTRIVVTTADHARDQGSDDIPVQHLLFRYVEAMASGSLLVAPSVPGGERYFRSGVHYVELSTDPQKSAEAIALYLENDEACQAMAQRGRDRILEICRVGTYWSCIDAALGTDAMLH